MNTSMADFERIVSEYVSSADAVTVNSGFRGFLDKFSMKCRNDLVREIAAEFLGTLILTLLGNATLGVARMEKFDSNVGYLTAPFGYGFALMLAIAVTGGVSGCHANPAVTVAFATVGKCPWRKVVPYVIAQYLGAFVSSAILFGVYSDYINAFDQGTRLIPPAAKATAGIFATYPKEFVSSTTSFFDQVLGTALLMLGIVSITDPNNMSVPKGNYPLYIGLVLAAILLAFPANCGAPLNPARDFAPRLFTAIVGYGNEVFSAYYHYFWIPIIGPHVGAIVGAWIYKMFIENHWPVDSYDFGAPSEIKTNGEFKKKDDLPFIDKKRSREVEVRKVEE